MSAQEPAAIHLRLPIARAAYRPTERELTYWPRYDSLTPGQRRIYLDWLARGRATPPPELGYTFLYIYGLERRALVDQQDQKPIFDEIMRLRALYAASAEPVSRSFDSYTSSFLWFLVAKHPQILQLKRVQLLMVSMPSWLEEHLACALSWFVATATPLPDWAAYLTARELPQSQQGVVTRRVGEQLKQLFFKRYAERFPTGLHLQSRRNRCYSYRPASAALSPMECIGPNPFARLSLLQSLSDLWNECAAELRKLSSIVAKQGAADLTPKAWEAMPLELRHGVDHPMTDGFCELVNRSAMGGASAMMTVENAANALGVNADGKLTLGQCRRMCETAEAIGYCLEPDCRLTGRGYILDEKIAVFLKTTEESADPGRYLAASCALRFGLSVAAADGHIDEKESSLLKQQVQCLLDLNGSEVRRLEALRDLVAGGDDDLSQIARLAKALSGPQRQAIAKLLLLIVAADGVVTLEEQRAVRVCYQKLGYEKLEIDLALASLTHTRDDELVSVQSETAPQQPSEAIPTQPIGGRPSPAGLKLNRAAIESIMKDTREVAEMLAAAMSNEVEQDQDQLKTVSPSSAPQPAQPAADVLAAMSASAVVSTTDSTLPSRYAAFYQALISQGEWDLKAATALARQHGHMLSGAIEALNEWAAEKYGGQLFVEDGPRLLVEQQYLS